MVGSTYVPDALAACNRPIASSASAFVRNPPLERWIRVAPGGARSTTKVHIDRSVPHASHRRVATLLPHLQHLLKTRPCLMRLPFLARRLASGQDFRHGQPAAERGTISTARLGASPTKIKELIAHRRHARRAQLRGRLSRRRGGDLVSARREAGRCGRVGMPALAQSPAWRQPRTLTRCEHRRRQRWAPYTAYRSPVRSNTSNTESSTL